MTRGTTTLTELARLGCDLVQGYLLGRPSEPWPDTAFAPKAAELLAS